MRMTANTDFPEVTSPILGSDNSAFIDAGRHISLTTLDNFGSSLQHGLYLGLDIQAEGTKESIMFGTGVANQTALFVRYNAGAVPGAISLEVRDEDGRRLLASAQTSSLAAKRL